MQTPSLQLFGKKKHPNIRPTVLICVLFFKSRKDNKLLMCTEEWCRASRMSVNMKEFITPTQLSVKLDSYVNCLICCFYGAENLLLCFSSFKKKKIFLFFFVIICNLIFLCQNAKRFWNY